MFFAIAFIAVLLTSFAAPAFAEELENNATIVCEGNERNLERYLQIWKVLFMDRDSERAGEFYAAEVISHNSDSGGGGGLVTPVMLAQMWEESRRLNPTRVIDDELILCAGDYVVVRTTVTSTDNEGVLPGYPPTGNPYTNSAIDIYRFEDGMVVERWGNADLVSIYRQVGHAIVPKSLVTQPDQSSAD